MSLVPISEIVAELAAGRMVIMVDDEDRENEGDVLIAADAVSAEHVAFMSVHCRGLICLTLTAERCDRLRLAPMVVNNGTRHGTAFTVSVNAATGITRGGSAADRARTVAAAVAANAGPADLVQPGYVFPLRAAEGGVLMRAGHTEAGCDLAAMAGRAPAALICEVLRDDGTMARLPDLLAFGQQHGLKVGSIADLIQHRAQQESLVSLLRTAPVDTASGRFTRHVYRDRFGGVHIALTLGHWHATQDVLVRVHEPASLLDLLEVDAGGHSWPLHAALSRIQTEGVGAALLLNCGDLPEDVTRRALGQQDNPATTAELALRTYGVGAQILRSLQIGRMRVLGHPRRMPSMSGFGLQVVGFLEQDASDTPAA